MSWASKEDLVNYTQEKANSSFATILGIVMIFGGIASLFTSLGLVFSLLITAGGIYFVKSGNDINRDYNNYLAAAEASGEMQAIVNDFAGSKSMHYDSIRLGESYIFTRKRGRPVQYAELRKVYVNITKTNGIETSRSLIGVATDGKNHILCDNLSKKDGDAEQIMAHIRYKNPHVQLGY